MLKEVVNVGVVYGLWPDRDRYFKLFLQMMGMKNEILKNGHLRLKKDFRVFLIK